MQNFILKKKKTADVTLQIPKTVPDYYSLYHLILLFSKHSKISNESMYHPKRRLGTALVQTVKNKTTMSASCMSSYLRDNGNAHVSHIGNDVTVLWWDVGMLEELAKVFLCHT